MDFLEGENSAYFAFWGICLISWLVVLFVLGIFKVFVDCYVEPWEVTSRVTRKMLRRMHYKPCLGTTGLRDMTTCVKSICLNKPSRALTTCEKIVTIYTHRMDVGSCDEHIIV